LGVKLVIFCKLFTTENRKKTLFSPKSYQQLFSPHLHLSFLIAFPQSFIAFSLVLRQFYSLYDTNPLVNDWSDGVHAVCLWAAWRPPFQSPRQLPCTIAGIGCSYALPDEGAVCLLFQGGVSATRPSVVFFALQ